MGGLLPLGVCRELSAVTSTERREPLALSSVQAVRMAGPLTAENFSPDQERVKRGRGAAR